MRLALLSASDTMFDVMEAKRSRRSWNGTNWRVCVAEGAIFGVLTP
jgi:hypothetical protein